MTDERWNRVKTIFHRALERAEEDRQAFVRGECGDDADLLESVLQLLRHDQTDQGGFEAGPIPGTSMSAMAEAAAGERLGPYRLISEIGVGGMGRVFLAERDDGVYHMDVAIKFVRHDVGSQAALDRFVAERQVLARLQHPNIASLLDGGVSDGGIPYLVMEYVPGRPISRYCDENRLTVRERVELFRGVCTAVHHAHKQLVVHRDLKPGNILVTEDGEVKLLDFGIAKLLADDVSDDTLPKTRTGVRLMTPEYASPEQVCGEDVTTASDTYALGVILYELITGQRPHMFETRSMAEIERIVLEERPRRPSTALTTVTREDTGDASSLGRLRSTDPHRLWREIQGDLDTIVLKALHKEPERRYETVAAFRDDLENFLAGRPVLARPDSVGYRARKFVGRNRVGVGTAAAVLLALISLASFYTLRLRTERDRVQAESDRAEQVIGFLQAVLGSPRPELDGREVTVFEVMEETADALGTDETLQPRVEAVLRATIGYTYQGLGLYDRSQEQVERALILFRDDPETPPARMAQAIHDVARLQHDRAVYDSARTNYELAIDLYRAEASEDPGLADVLNNVATLLSDQGELAASQEAYAEALEITRVEYGERSAEAAQILASMASNRLTLGAADEAADLLAEAVDIFRETGTHNLALTYVLNNLAYVTFEQGDLDGADSLFHQSLELRRVVHGDRHPEVGIALHSLGAQLHYTRGHYELAERFLLEALDIYREAFPNGHLYTSVSLTSLGKVRLEQDRLSEAEAALWQSFGLQQRLLPPGHGFTAHTQTLLGGVLTRQGRYVEAEPLLLAALSALEGGERNDMTEELVDTRQRLVALYEGWGRPEDAAPYR